MNDLVLIRTLFVCLSAIAALIFRPASLAAPYAALAGAALGLFILFCEFRLRAVSLRRLLGGVLGGLLGLLAAYLCSLVLGQALAQMSFGPAVEFGLLLLLTYIGLAVGASKGDLLHLEALGGVFGAELPQKQSMKILDTSVIIDGRIADVAETGFLEGTLGIPQFVLRELQMVADSGDSLKRNRGRRGLDVLQRLQKMNDVDVRILDEDFPQVREVDLKLLELAKAHTCTIVTNDFNLNKVAQLHGVEVLNINELANALKPVVLPGEIMRVFILKEGKEYNQGVAYLDDGTMVVVDNARRMISKTIDITVTSVLQTTAGKMIFGRHDERAGSAGRMSPEVAERAPREQSSSTGTS